MGKSITITPNSGLWDSEPTAKFQGNDSFFSVSINNCKPKEFTLLKKKKTYKKSFLPAQFNRI